MAVEIDPEDGIEPTETSPLLVKDNSRAIYTPSGSSTVDDVAKGQTDDGDEVADEEARETQEADNPLFEGKHEMYSQLYLLLPVLGIGVFLGAADQTIIVTCAPRIGTELNALNSTSWIATGYFLTLTTFQPTYGKVSDIFGRKHALLFAYAVFGMGCILCGISRNIQELVLSRAFQGVGGGGMMTVVSILMSDIIPLRERGTWQGYINLIYAAGAATGAPLGGVLADTIGWRWGFILQGPICFLALAAVYFILQLPPPDETDWFAKLRRVDFLGALVLLFATSSLLVGLDNGSNESWTSRLTIVALSLAVPFWAIFIFIEAKVAANPFAPGRIIFARSLFPPYMINCFGVGAYVAILFYVPLFLQATYGFSSTDAGLRLIPAILCSVSDSLGGGFFMKWTGRYKWLTVILSAVTLTGDVTIVLFTGGATVSSWGVIAGQMAAALGNGVIVTSSLIALISNADPADQAITTACSYLFRSLGSVLSVALAAAVVQLNLRWRLRASLGDAEKADEIVERVRHSLDYIKELQPGVREVVRECYRGAVMWAFVALGVMITGAVVASCFIREKKLSRR